MTCYLPQKARGRVQTVRRCMCCNTFMGLKEGHGETHGICRKCLWQKYPQFARKILGEDDMTLQKQTTEALRRVNRVLQERRNRYKSIFPKEEKDGFWMIALGRYGEKYNLGGAATELELRRFIEHTSEILEEVA